MQVSNLAVRLLSVLLFVLLSHFQVQGQVTLSIELKEINGRVFSLRDLQGSELTVVDFWATWCKPCVKSIPKLIELSENFESDKVKFVGINVDSPRNSAKVRPFSKSLGIPYPVLLDPDQELYGELLVNVLPTLFILDSDGKVLYTHEGYVPGDEKKIEEQLTSLLNND
ncbi:TlpA family protein disulfide reductase [Reichenbachiella ulvae]|uniref:TlpA family protein disulfide reductase n=1 Tax=Reichenbachiella ulvae TaxID=2980104 RepID=A0ABT3CSP0_9BACT|nr:TlpA disulfide reductase family protein [Reichenbachiella ulvae]MCV9386514.1 TlpA family protein disulfide reductase [Reichenbachiella ulvae]